MKKILIANRGEIALRVIRACRDDGRISVAVYADPDAEAPYVRAADEAWALPGATPAQTYLNIPALLEIAKRSGAEAVHPGYGFLSERAEFARAVQAAGLIWIGPDPETIARLGDKLAARTLARQVGAPLAPGSEGPVRGPEEIRAFAREHGLPVVIKAALGGGGRGMKVVRDLGEIEELHASAVREAEAAFGEGACYVERFLDRPRHVEAQILADRQGRVIVVGTRDCSLQRRNQKLVEEAPAPFLSADQRARIEEAACALCREAGYVGAGTVEFLLGADGLITFLEVNARLQVEHPVTEETAGLDLVVEQFRIAEGLPLSVERAPEPRGHAFEFRINAEDPARGFLPMPGLIARFDPPSGPGVRVDSGVEAGFAVPAAFDSLMAKLVVTGPTREAALARARRALAEFRIEGIPSTLPFHRAVLEAPAFADAARFGVHTTWIETEFAADLAAQTRPEPAESSLLRGALEIDGQRHEVGLGREFLDQIARAMGGIGGGAPAPQTSPAAQDQPAEGAVAAPIAGLLREWLAQDGAAVEAGQPLAAMEAMKMETRIPAPKAGILRILAQVGEAVPAGRPIAEILPQA